MTILKCKMCGGDIELSTDKTYGTCDSCGSTMTLPKIDDAQRANLFNRANRFRQIGEFDKAISAYENILNQQDHDAEAHWCVVLSRFGIEYVEDPKNGERIPTCHRLQTMSILSDPDYLAALEYTSDDYTKELYEKEANRIAEIQKEIIAISANEKPYDIFICYKESDESGNRTKDSALAQEVYYQLINEGYKVFFSRITLEGKLGQAYEPYIFAALNSAKVMLVIGSKQEYFDAIWVKNEWSRYLDLLSKDKSRLLIPCYRDMDPYDIPDALSMFQSQDMGKIGFVQDLIRGVKKVLEVKTTVVADVVTSTPEIAIAPGVASLLKRGHLFLEDGNFTSADEYFEKVLDIDPECADAYIGKFCATERLHQIEEMGGKPKYSTIPTDMNYTKALRFGDAALGAKLNQLVADALELKLRRDYTVAIQTQEGCNYIRAAEQFEALKDYRDSAEQARLCREAQLEWNYNTAINAKKNATTVKECTSVKEVFLALGTYKDSAKQVEECDDLALDVDYQIALELKLKKNYLDAIKAFESISEYKDSVEQIEQCKASKKADEDAIENKQKKFVRVLLELVIIVVIVFAYTSIIQSINRNKQYNQAIALYEAGDYDASIEAFTELGGFKDSEEQILSITYDKAMQYLKDEDYDTAIEVFTELVGYKDSEEQILSITYDKAMQYLENEDYNVASNIFTSLDDYKDSQDLAALAKDKREKDTIAIFAGDQHSLILNVDGTVVAAGRNDDGQCNIENWTDIVSISAGGYHTIGLKSDGTVVAVGNNDDGQCNIENWTDIVSVSAGSNHTVGLKSDGTVVAVGNNDSGQCAIENWANIVSISVGSNHTVGLKSDGTVVAIGNNQFGQCDIENWTDIISISAGGSGNHTVGLKSDGTMVAVGRNYNKQCDIENWTDIVSISASGNHTVGLKSDGTVVGVGNHIDGIDDIENWTDIISISIGGNHAVGLKSDGTVVATGSNGYGQCDIAEWSDDIVYNS